MAVTYCSVLSSTKQTTLVLALLLSCLVSELQIASHRVSTGDKCVEILAFVPIISSSKRTTFVLEPFYLA